MTVPEKVLTTAEPVALDRRSDPDVRKKAVFWLGQRHSEDNAQFLKQLFAKTASDAPAIRRIVLSVADIATATSTVNGNKSSMK